MSTSSIESIDITSTPTPTTKRNSTFSDVLRREDFHCQKPGCEEVRFYFNFFYYLTRCGTVGWFRSLTTYSWLANRLLVPSILLRNIFPL